MAKRQVLPPHTALADLDQSVIYLPPSNHSGFSSLVSAASISGTSATETTRLMYETILDPQRGLIFAVASGSEISLESFLIRGTARLTPPDDPNGILGKYVLLASSVGEWESEDALNRELDAFIYRYLDAPKFPRRLLRSYIKLSYQLDGCSSLPYLKAQGPYATGKTRLLEIAGNLSCRGTFVGGSVSGAALFRIMDAYHPTLCLDEADFRNSDATSDITKVLNVGYRRNMPLFRCNADMQPIPYDCFGAKIMSSRAPFADAALESRCITIETCSKPVRADIKRQLPPDFHAEAQALRNKLLRYKFDVQVQCDESRLRSLEPRLVEIGTPLLAVTPRDENFERRLREFLKTRATERRQESAEAIFVRALQMLFEASGERATVTLSVKAVAERASRLRAAQEPEVARLKPAAADDPLYFNFKKAGQVLRNLGFAPEHTRNGARFEVSQDALSELLERYGTQREDVSL